MNNLPEIKTDKSLTPRQQAFLSYLFTEAGGDVRAAMDMAGYSKQTKISEIVGALHDQIQELTRQFVNSTAPSALFTLLSVLKNPTQPGANVALKAADSLLDRGGIIKNDGSKGETTVQNIFILPEKRVNGKTVISIGDTNIEVGEEDENVIDVDYEEVR